jgi:hypothetical protein
MKTTLLKLLFLFIFSLQYVSCKKDVQIKTEIDFRDKYIGKYKVIETKSCYGSCWNCYSKKDSIISIGYGYMDSTISALGYEYLRLDETGSYSGNYFGIRLWNDSIKASRRVGGLGCGVNYYYIGYRISKRP